MKFSSSRVKRSAGRRLLILPFRSFLFPVRLRFPVVDWSPDHWYLHKSPERSREAATDGSPGVKALRVCCGHVGYTC